MGNRLSKIVTRTGDDGTTGLADGSRQPKHHARIEAIGVVDELNSFVGLLRVEALDAETDALLATVQNDLFDLGGELAIPGRTRPHRRTRKSAGSGREPAQCRPAPAQGIHPAWRQPRRGPGPRLPHRQPPWPWGRK